MMEIDSTVVWLAITVAYRGPSLRRPARLTATASLASITIPWNHGLSMNANYAAAALALCDKFDWNGRLVHGIMKNKQHVFVRVS